jgi:hypothetical protein
MILGPAAFIFLQDDFFPIERMGKTGLSAAGLGGWKAGDPEMLRTRGKVEAAKRADHARY